MAKATSRARAKPAAKPKSKPSPAPVAKSVRFLPDALSRIMVVDIVMPSGQLSYRLQASPDGPWEPKWNPIDKNAYSLLSAGNMRSGDVAIAVQSTKAPSVYFIAQKGHGPGGNPVWSRRAKLGLPARSAGFKHLVCCSDCDGRVEIFGLDGKSGKLWWIFQNPDRIVTKKVRIVPPGAKKPITVTVQETAPPKKPWSAWQEIKGLVLADLIAANNADGRIVLIGHGAAKGQGHLFVNEQAQPRTLKPADWAGWHQLSSSASGPVSSVTACLDVEGALNVFGLGAGTEVVHTRQLPPGSRTWAPWSAPGLIGQDLLSVASGIDGDGHIILVAQSAEKVLYGNHQTDVEFARWNNWQRISMSDDLGTMELAYNANGRVTLFLRADDKSYRLLAKSQVELNSTEWELMWKGLGSNVSSSFRLAYDVAPGR